jgi:hypothetical protein
MESNKEILNTNTNSKEETEKETSEHNTAKENIENKTPEEIAVI